MECQHRRGFWDADYGGDIHAAVRRSQQLRPGRVHDSYDDNRSGADTHTYAHSVANPDTESHAYADTDANTDCNTNPVADADTYRQSATKAAPADRLRVARSNYFESECPNLRPTSEQTNFNEIKNRYTLPLHVGSARRANDVCPDNGHQQC